MSALELQGVKEPVKAAARSGSLTPWLWGPNGAASVLASVVAFFIVLDAERAPLKSETVIGTSIPFQRASLTRIDD